MIPLFGNPQVQNIDLLAIQEPWQNPAQATTYHPLKNNFSS